MLFYAFLVCLLGMLVVHTTRPRFRRRVISAARFFLALPPPQKSSPKLTFNNPFRIPVLYLRLLLVGLLLLAVLAAQRTVRVPGKKQIHVWFLLDSSSSMTARHPQGTHWQAGLDALAALADEFRTENNQGTYRLSLFDMAIRDVGEGSLSEPWVTRLKDQEPRELGTQLTVLRPFLKQVLSTPAERPFTHLVIVSDVPAPAWLADLTGLAVLWRDISHPGFNVGMSGLEVGRNPLTGQISEIQVVVAAHGTKAPNTLVRVRHEQAATGESLPVVWRNEGFGTATLSNPMPGTYEVSLSQGGDYAADDRMQFLVPPAAGLRVDWQLTDRRLPDLLGWTITQQNPAMSVGVRPGPPEPGVSERIPGDGVRPFLWVGPGLEARDTQVRDFIEASPLVADIHFDVLERFRPRVKGPEGSFRSHLRDLEGNLWIGATENPRGVYVAGLPTLEDSDRDRLLTTLFFNGVRWLVREAEFPPLYTLTSPQQPLAEGTRLNLHPGEGAIDEPPLSVGNLDDPSQAGSGAGVAVWPWLVVAALAILILERVLSLSGRRAWQ